MKRKSLVTAISISKELDTLLDRLQSKSGKSRSLLLREMINYYVRPAKTDQKPSTVEPIDDTDANKILKLYYRILSEIRPKPTIVIGVAIANKKNKVVIGLRKNSDPSVRDLHWTFPTGRFSDLDFEKEVVKTVKTETGLDVKVLSLVHARLIPDSPDKKIRIVALYYHCKILKGSPGPGGDFKEVKWVSAPEVNRYFTTSVSDEIMHFLGRL